eukprot:9742987-Alexandrium_andersonii.AAC.1
MGPRGATTSQEPDSAKSHQSTTCTRNLAASRSARGSEVARSTWASAAAPPQTSSCSMVSTTTSAALEDPTVPGRDIGSATGL